jgi:O-antigen/teichoic acid export membrane protein
MSIARNTAITIAAQVILLGLQMVSGMMTTRLLGAELYGDMTLLLVTSMLFMTAFQFSLIYGIVNVWSKGGHRPGEISKTVIYLAFLLSILCTFTQAIYFLVTKGVLYDHLSYTILGLGLAMTPLLLCLTLLEIPLRLSNNIVFYNISRIIPKVVGLALLTIWVVPYIAKNNGWDIFFSPHNLASALVDYKFPLSLALTFTITGMIVGLIVILFFLRLDGTKQDGSSWAFNKTKAKTMMSGSVQAYPSLLALYLLSRIDFFIISRYLDSETLGYYNVAYTLAELVTLIGFAINTAITPYAASSDHELAYDISSRSLRHNLLYSTIVALGFLVVSGPLVLLYAGSDYASAIYPMRILLPGMVFYFLFGIYNILVARQGWFSGSNIILGTSVIVNFAGCIMIVEEYSLTGIAIMKSATNLLALLAYALWFAYKGLVPLSSFWKFDRMDVEIWIKLIRKTTGIDLSTKGGNV